jgi:hypothetical protein
MRVLTFGERMKLSWKIALASTVTLLILAIGLSFAHPFLESHSRYCFYCGQVSTAFRLLGLPVWRSKPDGNLYADTVKTPPHVHRMIEICGYRLWLFRGNENWDEFGWTGTPIRAALVEGLATHPERQAEILREFLSLDPQDQQAKLHFVKTHRAQEAGQGRSSGRP